MGRLGRVTILLNGHGPSAPVEPPAREGGGLGFHPTTAMRRNLRVQSRELACRGQDEGRSPSHDGGGQAWRTVGILMMSWIPSCVDLTSRQTSEGLGAAGGRDEAGDRVMRPTGTPSWS